MSVPNVLLVCAVPPSSSMLFLASDAVRGVPHKRQTSCRGTDDGPSSEQTTSLEYICMYNTVGTYIQMYLYYTGYNNLGIVYVINYCT